MDKIDSLIDGFVADGWKSEPFEAMLAIWREHPDDIPRLVINIVDRLPDGGTFLDAALSYLPEEDFAVAVEHAWAAIERRGHSRATDAVMEYASLQVPHLLTPYLERFFTLMPNEGSYFDVLPWRAADGAELRRLRRILASDQPAAIRRRAWRCLHAASDLADVSVLAEHYVVMGHDAPVEGYLLETGIDVSTTPPRRLTTEHVLHLSFRRDYFTESRSSHMERKNHPTWDPPADRSGIELGFGGTVTGRACGNCGDDFDGLVELTGEAAELIEVGQRVQLVTCLTCLGWEIEVMFFAHNDAGVPTAIALPSELSEPQFPAGSLARTTVVLTETPTRWRAQEWGSANSRENLNRVGGDPTWVQSAEYPDCPRCDQLMPFIMQIDSELPDSDGAEWLWGSGGICFVFWCEQCAVSATLWQCT